jgi:hypothetical protein
MVIKGALEMSTNPSVLCFPGIRDTLFYLMPTKKNIRLDTQLSSFEI